MPPFSNVRPSEIKTRVVRPWQGLADSRVPHSTPVMNKGHTQPGLEARVEMKIVLGAKTLVSAWCGRLPRHHVGRKIVGSTAFPELPPVHTQIGIAQLGFSTIKPCGTKGLATTTGYVV